MNGVHWIVRDREPQGRGWMTASGSVARMGQDVGLKPLQRIEDIDTLCTYDTLIHRKDQN